MFIIVIVIIIMSIAVSHWPATACNASENVSEGRKQPVESILARILLLAVTVTVVIVVAVANVATTTIKMEKQTNKAEKNE